MYDSVSTNFDNTNDIFPFLNRIHPISNDAMAFLVEKIHSVAIKKGKFLHSPLGSTEAIYFIKEGLVRGFLKDEGSEITTWINDENNIVGTIRNLGTEIVSEEYIQALEDTELIMLHRDTLEEWYATFNEANTLSRKLLEMYYRDADERAYLCRLPSAEKRYRRFARTRPKLLGRVALKYMASYLGMKVETLCRIRAKISSSTC